MESERALQQRQPVGNNEQREQVRGAEANRNGERRRHRGKPKPFHSAKHELSNRK